MKRITTTFTTLIAAAMLAFVGSAHAATIHGPIVSDTADARVKDSNGDFVGDGVTNVGSGSLRVGGFSDDNTTGAILPFELPAMGAGESIVTDASLTFTIFSRKHDPSSIFQQGDLFVTGVRSTASVLASDFDTTGTHTLLQAGVIGNNDSNTTLTSDAAASTALASWLNTGNRYQAGDFVFLAILPTDVHVDDSGWDVGSANRGDNNMPELSLTTAVPEPASVAMGLVGLGGLALRRRRRQ